MTRINIKRRASIPDRFRLARYRKSPEMGPRILFFSGGTALRTLSRRLIEYTHNSIHLITPFDSGGSSAHLRKALAMPAVGDLRNRLMALADPSIRGNHEIASLFNYRFPRKGNAVQLRRRLQRMESGDDPADLVAQ